MKEEKILKSAVEADPDNLKVHDKYISVMDIKDPSLILQYNLWLKKYPHSATVPFSIGKALQQVHDPRCQEYLLKATALKPDLSEAWALLSYNSSLVGDEIASSQFMKQAAFSDPENADYAFYYALSYKSAGEPAKYDSLMLNVVYRFPDHLRAAEALYQLASYPYNMNEKNTYYDALYNMYSEKQPSWFLAGMFEYYDYLLNTFPEKAFDLALRMVLKVKINRQDWKQRFIVARKFIEARKLLDSNKTTAAFEILTHISLNNKIMGRSIHAEETLSIFKSEVTNASNNTRGAFDSLAMLYSKNPSDRIRKALLSYAAILNMDSTKVDSDVFIIRQRNASKRVAFTLENYTDNKIVSLSDYKGKVVLLTYWYPSCGPCREEFSHFESVLKKISNKNIAYLAINIYNIDEKFVMPLVKNSGYTFVPLRDDPGGKTENLPRIQSVPSSFLIDQNGKIIFSGFQIDGDNERTMELMIRETLNFVK